MRKWMLKKLIKLSKKVLGEEETQKIIDDTMEKTIERFKKSIN